MAKTLRKTEVHVSPGSPNNDKPACEDCLYVGLDRDRLFCNVPIPPHVSTSGKIPYVNKNSSCAFFKRK